MTRRTKKAWTKCRELISKQARSGQAVKAFCDEHGLCRSYFFVWKKRLGEAPATKFLEVQLKEAVPSATKGTCGEIRLQNGRSGGGTEIRCRTCACVAPGTGSSASGQDYFCTFAPA